MNDMETTDRLVVRFDPDRMLFWPGDAKRRDPRYAMKGMTILHFVERINRTKDGGTYVTKRFTVRDRDGRMWFGQVKTATDIVRLRPATKDPRT
jgi:hypothetical protein